jgi:hypothetical protein
MVKSIGDVFPRLQGSAYQVTSPPNDKYNCIAWAAGDTKEWWWPNPGGKEFWPAGVLRMEIFSAFQQMFALLGYVVCAGEERETGFEKIALFADTKGFPLHAARQLPNGRWTSKLGEREDIEHALHDLEGTVYGSVVLIMKLPLAGTTTLEETTTSEK